MAYDGELIDLRSGETADLGDVRLGEPGELVVEVRPGEIAREEIELVPAFPVRVTFEFPDAADAWGSVDWEVQDPSGFRVRSGHVRAWPDFPGAAAPGITDLGLPTGR